MKLSALSWTAPFAVFLSCYLPVIAQDEKQSGWFDQSYSNVLRVVGRYSVNFTTDSAKGIMFLVEAPNGKAVETTRTLNDHHAFSFELGTKNVLILANIASGEVKGVDEYRLDDGCVFLINEAGKVTQICESPILFESVAHEYSKNLSRQQILKVVDDLVTLIASRQASVREFLAERLKTPQYGSTISQPATPPYSEPAARSPQR